ncbi:hypothetical protein NQ317_004970 [Molorchus minor]|uniref:Aldehyde dehydrogenase domain-containing protein n=1 Tax=Molorchus minor TaxID=1323400 RepID=A0ABQ9K2Y8_9CUCU|nr:hypothetical protein NQ317_004970 [Molorchus minor]
MVMVNKTNVAMDVDQSPKKTIREIFNTMVYGPSYENVSSATEWIKNKEPTFFAYIDNAKENANGLPTKLYNAINNEELCTVHVPEVDTIQKILSKCNGKKSCLGGILSKDTESKAVPLLAQYFHYYSSFAVTYSEEEPNWKPEGVAIGVFSNLNALSNLGLMLAPALAAGYNVVLQVGTKLSIVTALILQIANKVGIPEDAIRLIPSDDDELFPYLNSDNVAMLTLFVDLLNEKIPLIVVDDADLDSAAASIAEVSWGYNGLSPWAVGTVLIQENIFDTFLNKLRTKIQSTKMGSSHDKTADLSIPSQESREKITELVEKAKRQGIEVFQFDENLSTPALLIGAKVQTKVLTSDDDQGALVTTVLPFRTIDEAVKLANNTRQGLAASVWTENIGVANEITRKLQVSNVWVNTHGLTSADITMCPMKESGIGYFGGKEGFYEYVQVKKSSATINISVPSKAVNDAVVSAIRGAIASQKIWRNMPRINKIRLLQKFASFIDENRKKFSSDLSEKWLESWITSIYQCISSSDKQNYSTLHYGYNLTVTREPRGIVAIETKAIDTHNKKTNFNCTA